MHVVVAEAIAGSVEEHDFRVDFRMALAFENGCRALQRQIGTLASMLRVITPGANCRLAPTTLQTVSPQRPELRRFMTTDPTAIMPSRLERLDSKYIARARHSWSRELARTALTLRDPAIGSSYASEDITCPRAAIFGAGG